MQILLSISEATIAGLDFRELNRAPEASRHRQLGLCPLRCKSIGTLGTQIPPCNWGTRSSRRPGISVAPLF
jgi:hypothetical protein